MARRGVTPEDRGEQVLLNVRVQPRASKNALKIEEDGRLRVYVTAPPAEGAANEAVCRYIAQVLGTPRRAVALVHGAKSRDKVLSIDGRNRLQVEAALAAGSR